MKHFSSNMTRGEFIDWIRYSAIAGGMPQQFIDRVDELTDMADLEAELEKAGEERAQAEEECDDLLTELKDLRDAVQDQSDLDPSSMSENLLAALKWANKALERHSGT